MSHAERADAWAALASAALPTGALVALLKAFGSPGAVLGAPQARIAAIVGAEAAARLAAPDPERSRATRAWLDDPAHRLLAWDDEAYPRPLDLVRCRHPRPYRGIRHGPGRSGTAAERGGTPASCHPSPWCDVRQVRPV